MGPGQPWVVISGYRCLMIGDLFLVLSAKHIDSKKEEGKQLDCCGGRLVVIGYISYVLLKVKVLNEWWYFHIHFLLSSKWQALNEK